jgi:hypothetical protein
MEVSSAIKILKNNRAPGSDGLPQSFLNMDLIRSTPQIIEEI